MTNAVFLGTPPPVGFGFSQFAIAGSYGTPIVCSMGSYLIFFLLLANLINQVAVFIGEIVGRYANEWFMNMGIRKNKGVFEAEIRLW